MLLKLGGPRFQRVLFKVFFGYMLCASIPRLAADVIVTSYNSGGNSGFSTKNGQPALAQEFTLNVAGVVGSVDLALEGPGGINLSSLTLEIFSNSSNAPGAEIPNAADTGATGTLSNSSFN